MTGTLSTSLKIGIVMAMFAAVISLLLKQPENQL
jgi:hypothetical protein